MGVDTCTSAVAGRRHTWRVIHVYTGTRGRGAALVGGMLPRTGVLGKNEGCVSALHWACAFLPFTF